MHIAYMQHCGKKGWIQQDALLAGNCVIQSRDIKVAYEANADKLILAVADGVASSPYSQLASRFVLESLLQESDERESELNTRLARKIHGRLCDRYAKGRTLGSASTLAAVSISGECGVAFNVGDSRIYRINCMGKWDQLSHDHTVLAGLIEKGLADPQRQYSRIYDALEHCLIADHDEDDFAVHCRAFSIQADETLLLCTDGVHDCLGNAAMQSIFDGNALLNTQLDLYRQAIFAAGAPDNFSLVLARKPASSICFTES